MIAGIKVEIGGVVRVVPPLNFRALIDLQDRFKDFKPGSIDASSVGIVLECAFRALKRNYPDITMEELEEHLDVGNMMDVMEAVVDVSGLKRKKREEQEQGERTTSSGGQT